MLPAPMSRPVESRIKQAQRWWRYRRKVALGKFSFDLGSSISLVSDRIEGRSSVHPSQKTVVGSEQRYDTQIDEDVGGLDHLSVVGAQIFFDRYEQSAAGESYCSRQSA